MEWINILNKCKMMIEQVRHPNETLQEVADYLHNAVPHYDWVGFYMVDPQNKNRLILGPYAGDPTSHTKIDFGQGVCGQAAIKKETIIIADVNKESNYLSCSPSVQSEVVVPIFNNGEFIGEIDIDSHSRDVWKKKDIELLEAIAGHIGKMFLERG